MSNLKVLMDTSPLDSGHAVRGIGTYTRNLLGSLEKESDLEIIRSSSPAADFNPDVIHFPFFDLFRPTLPLLQKRPVVVTIHDVIPLLFPDYYPVGIKGNLAFKKQKLALKRVAQVITDSNASKNDIEKYLNVPANKIVVIPLAASDELTPATPSLQKIVKNKYSLPDEYILYVGDINYNKNLPQLIKALKYLPTSLHLVLVGKNFISQEIPEWKWIETQIALSNVAARVHFITSVTTDAVDELSAIYSQAIAYVQPSLYEGFGLPVLEAMRCNTPVVATHLSSLPEVTGKFGVLTGDQAEDLAGGVQSVSDWSKTVRQEKVHQALEWSRTFTWQKVAHLTKKVYQKVAKIRN